MKIAFFLAMLVVQAALAGAWAPEAGTVVAEEWRPKENDHPAILVWPEPVALKETASGYASAAQGRRPYQEDSYILNRIPMRGGREGPLLAGVFDGHGGSECSSFLRDKMLYMLGDAAGRDPASDWAALMKRTIVTLDDSFARVSGVQHVGSTAAVAVVDHKKTIWTANVGDSRIVLVKKGGRAVPLTIDHKPDAPEERARIEGTPGGFVRHFGVPRAQGILAMSRSVGDHALRPYVICAPDASSMNIDPEKDAFLVIASDGFFDVMSNEELGRVVETWKGEEKDLPDHLVHEALRRGSADNITVLVVPL